MTPKTDSLVSTEWLAEHLEDPEIRVVDIRGYVRKIDLGGGRQRAEYTGARDEYEGSHIPGAVYVDWTVDITDPESEVAAQVSTPERFGDLMESLGIGDSTRVVVYDHSGGQFATRLWWALTYYGHDGVHDGVSVLDGGWKKWIDEDRPTTDVLPAPEPATFTPRPRPEWRADADSVLAASESGGFILDARDPGQYSGAVTRGDGRPGHVPGARHLHADELFDPESGTFLSDEAAEEKLREAGVSGDREEPIVAYCNGGVAATVPLFALHRLGYKNLANYDGSWNEWGSGRDLPSEVSES